MDLRPYPCSDKHYKHSVHCLQGAAPGARAPPPAQRSSELPCLLYRAQSHKLEKPSHRSASDSFTSQKICFPKRRLRLIEKRTARSGKQKTPNARQWEYSRYISDSMGSTVVILTSYRHIYSLQYIIIIIKRKKKISACYLQLSTQRRYKYD